MRRVPLLVCTSDFDVVNDFDTRRTTSAWTAIPIIKPDGTATWEPTGLGRWTSPAAAGRRAFVPRRALFTWLFLMRGTDPNSPRDKSFVRHMEECVNDLIEA